MIDLAFRHYTLPLNHPFTIARGTIRAVETLVVELHEAGCFGYGEAPAHGYYRASIPAMAAGLGRLAPRLSVLSASDLPAVLGAAAETLGDDLFARAAVDAAIHDLWARRQDLPLAAAWGVDPAGGPESCFTIGLDTPAVMEAKLAEASGWPAYKIKVGGEADIEALARLRSLTDRPFRIDANGGWSVRRTLELAGRLADLGVEFIEQPLPPGDPGMVELRRQCPLPIFADEDCRTEADIARCGELFDGIVVKLVKCGGLSAGRRMIERARAAGLAVMIGCMTESTVGISAAAQLVPLADHADIDGAALLAADIATGVSVREGRRQVPDAAGLGIELIGGPLQPRAEAPAPEATK